MMNVLLSVDIHAYMHTYIHTYMCMYVCMFVVYTMPSNGDCHLPVLCALCSSAGAQTGLERAGAAGEAVQICSATASGRDASKQAFSTPHLLHGRL